jgi:hypothetical protein
VITRGIREFMSRDWRKARENKDAYWRDRIARLGPGEAFRIADELRKQAILVDPGWRGAARRGSRRTHRADPSTPTCRSRPPRLNC